MARKQIRAFFAGYSNYFCLKIDIKTDCVVKLFKRLPARNLILFLPQFIKSIIKNNYDENNYLYIIYFLPCTYNWATKLLLQNWVDQVLVYDLMTKEKTILTNSYSDLVGYKLSKDSWNYFFKNPEK